ncbi:unnamed protein product, partial [Polarella glacialis]
WHAADVEVRKAALLTFGYESTELGPEAWCVKVPFQKLPPRLLAERRVTLQGGLAQVSESEAFCLLANGYRVHLERTLIAAQSANIDAHIPLRDAVAVMRGRIERLLTTWSVELDDRAENGGGGVGLRPHNFQEYQKSFPPCMRHLVQTQRAGCHLKHKGRMQLRPFLREAGFSFGDSLRWWSREMRRDAAVTDEAVQLEYTYE